MRKLAAPLAVAALAAATCGGAAEAASSIDGTYGGSAVHPNPLIPESAPLDKPYTTRFGVTIARKGADHRLASIYASIRTWCPEDRAIRDIVLFKTWTRGPRVTSKGKFTVEGKGVTVQGSASGGRVSGSARASAGGCSVRSVSLTARRRATDW